MKFTTEELKFTCNRGPIYTRDIKHLSKFDNIQS